MFDRYGEKLVGGSIVYTALALTLSYTWVAAGGSPPPFLPTFVSRVLGDVISAWNSISGTTINASSVEQVVAVINLVTGVGELILGTMVSTVMTYLWLSYLAAAMLPYPLNVLSIPVWVLGVTATWIMVVYLLRRVRDALTRIPLPVPGA